MERKVSLMNYGKINKYDVANGPGVRVSLFVSGCRRHCKGCFNEETWNFEYGEPYTVGTLGEIITAMAPDYISGLTILGGEPFEPENVPEVKKLVKTIKSLYPLKTIWIYTGNQVENLFHKDLSQYDSDVRSILENTDVLVDGPFIEDLKDISLTFRGSSNQRIVKNPLVFLALQD